MKRCTHCGTLYPNTADHFAPSGKYLSSWCRDCKRERDRQRYAERRGMNTNRCHVVVVEDGSGRRRALRYWEFDDRTGEARPRAGETVIGVGSELLRLEGG